MFILALIKDKVRLNPAKFAMNYLSALEDSIHNKFSNKILPDVGLCVSVYDFTKIGDPFIFPGDGASYTDVEFRMVVFRPDVGEVIKGTIKSCDHKNGIRVSLGFFEDIYIPPHLLMANSEL